MSSASMKRRWAPPHRLTRDSEAAHAALAIADDLLRDVAIFARRLGGGRNADAPAIDGALAALGRRGCTPPRPEGQDFTNNFDDHPEQGLHAFHRTQHQRPIARPFAPAKSNRRPAAPQTTCVACNPLERIEP